MHPKYKVTFRKKNDGLAIYSFQTVPDSLPNIVALETRKLLSGDVARDGFTVEIVPIEG